MGHQLPTWATAAALHGLGHTKMKAFNLKNITIKDLVCSL